jgi:hypothetical protein
MYTFIVDLGILDLKPTWFHDLALEHQELERARASPENTQEVRAGGIIL